MKKWLEDELNERWGNLCGRTCTHKKSMFNYYKSVYQATYCYDVFEEEDVVLSIKECLLEGASERAEYLFNSIKWED